MGYDPPPANVTFAPRPNRAVFPFSEGAPKRPSASRARCCCAAKRTLDFEDRFERNEKAETRATNPGTDPGAFTVRLRSVTGSDRRT
jgi:hypothetical protein